MAELQNTVLEIDKHNYEEADFMSRRFINAETRNRAYINVLSAELFINYLAGKGYDTQDIVSMHSISKVIEDVDIADILLPNVHLDVRAVFDDDKIFIPKSHFEFEITPDIYIVLKLSKNLKEAVFLGYFKPSQVNKKYENKDYYFIPKKNLSTPDTLFTTLSEYNSPKDKKLEQQDFLKGRELSVSLSDHNLDKAERKELYRLMLTDSMLRDSIAEFDNFEVLSNQVSAVLLERVEIKERAAKEVPGIAALTTEEILKEGIEAAISEKTAEAAEVFDTVAETTEAVEEIAETTAKLSDVFEAAPVDELAVEPEFSKEEKTMPTIEILKIDENNTEPETNSADTDDNSECENQNEEEQQESQEEELSIEDIDDELTIEEDIQISDIDTLETEEVESSIEETSVSQDEIEQVQDESVNAVASETEESPVLEDEISQEEELSIEDIDNELTMEEDIQISDIDTLETEEVESSIEETSVSQDEFEQVEGESVNAVAAETEGSPILEDEISQEEELSIEGIDDELTIEEDIQISDIDTLETEEVESSIEETSASQDEIEQVQDESVNAVASETEGSPVLEDEIPQEEELSIEDIDNELTIEEDIQITDLEVLESDNNEIEEETEQVNNAVEPIQEKPAVDVSVSNLNIKPVPMQELSVDTLLDNAIAAIDTKKVEVPEKVSDAAIKMTSVAGGAVDELVKKAEKVQAGELNHLEYQHTADMHSVPQSGEYMSFVGGLSDAKRQANMLAEAQGLAEKPTDLSQLDTVETEKQEEFVHEVIDMDNIETVEREEFVEDESGIVELDEINCVDSPTKPLPDIEELTLQPIETETMELPDLNSYTINEDGSSPMDNMNWGPEEEPNPDDLLDLDAAESLIGDDTEVPQTDFTDNLVDGSAFQVSDTVYDIGEQPAEEVIISEDTNSDSDIFEFSEDFFNDLSEDETTEEISENNTPEPTEQEVDIHVQDDVAPIEITDSPEDELTGEILEDTMELSQEENAINTEESVQEAVSEETEQDWTDDIGYETLADIQPEVTANAEDKIVEQSVQTPMYSAKNNSTVISDKTFSPGEINIDINTNKIPQPALDNDTISSLYDKNPAVATNTILNNPGRLSTQKQKSSGGLVAGLGIAGVLILFVLLFAFGFGVSKFLKGPADETPQPISEDGGNLSENYAQQQSPESVGQVVEMNNNNNALASTAGTTSVDKTTFVEVKKLSWEVPGNVSAEPAFQQYFQSAGKSLKSALMTDLLSVSDKAYSSEMRVSITFNKDGSFRDARIITASGSNQIDNIVLRTVNQTLTVLKAPHSVGSYENTTAVLKIYL